MSALPISPQTPWLAPLAGYSDLPFRLLCREYGAAVACTEMVSAKGLIYGSPGTADLLQTIEADSPLVVQLFGNEIPFMEKSVLHLRRMDFRYFDVNMGCSVPKVTRTGCGAAMLKDVENTLAVARAILPLAEQGHMGFKMRLGWDDAHMVWEELALRLQDAGAGWITLHPRTARQGFGGHAHWPALRALRTLLDIPVLASGDLFTAADGVRCLQETGVSGLMYARGAMNNPAIFAAHKALVGTLEGATPQEMTWTPDDLICMIRRHMALAREYSFERTALLKMRTFVPRYVRDFPNVRPLRKALSTCTSWEVLDNLLDDLRGHCPHRAEDEGGTL